MGLNASIRIRVVDGLLLKHINALAGRMCEAFGYEDFLIPEARSTEKDTRATHAIEHLHGNFYEVNYVGRYYGRDYERGDAPFILTLLRWLYHSVLVKDIWYGADSTDWELVDLNYINKLETYFITVGHEPYFYTPPKSYDAKRYFCALCQREAVPHYWGQLAEQRVEGQICHGCGMRVLYHHATDTFTLADSYWK